MATDQLLLNGFESAATNFRPIHYLGSKLRMLPAIRAAIDDVAPSGTLCDIFAGSGTVALAFSRNRPVIAVDIQEYSRVLCSALLSRTKLTCKLGKIVSEQARRSQLLADINAALAPILEYENECVRHAVLGNAEPLCDFIELGSLALFEETRKSAAGKLNKSLATVSRNLHKLGLNTSPRALMTRHFGGAYFSFHQAAVLDALLEAAHSLSPELKDIGLAPILSTASEIVNTVGKHFAQPIRPRDSSGRPKKNLVTRVLKDRLLDTFAIHEALGERYEAIERSCLRHKAIRDNVDSFLSTYPADISVFYADPPYTRDHYSRFYHVLETMCLRDEPRISKSTARRGTEPTISRGLYRADRHQSPYCIISQAPDAFRRLFAGVRRYNAPLILSYSPYDRGAGARPRLMNVEQITSLAKQHFNNVQTKSVGRFSHSKLNLLGRNAIVNEQAEVLITCVP